MTTVYVPNCSGIVKIAVDEFLSFAERIGGQRPALVTGTPPEGDFITLGAENENSFIAQAVLDGKFDCTRTRVGTDDYYIRSFYDGGRRILALGGGRPRALLYAVYAYFELHGCSYFWDGDVVPGNVELRIADFDIVESPRFQYRGLRYFAHRGLHRFQAEHWDLADWKREIDWMLKKHLNIFMLRIGLNDLFQKAFPDIVPYPQDNVPCSPEFARSYNDRTHFWSVEERGRLRRELLRYAFERDLMHPEDTGTMSHWYSRTPQEFLDKVNPPFIPQATGTGYSENSGLVWDIRHDDQLDNYWKLTKAHIDNYGGGKGEIFHTIGLAERDVSPDRNINHFWKLYTYRRIIKRLRDEYPNAPLLIGSWDFVNNLWSPEQLAELVGMLDPENTLIFDYTSDFHDWGRSFVNWSVMGKFPWIFGIFQAFEPGNEPRGNYQLIKERLALAAADPQCRGMVIWPENSHGDTLMYEYFAANAWNPEQREIDVFLPEFCRRRYGVLSGEMLRIRRAALPCSAVNWWNYDMFAGDVLFAHLCEYLEWDVMDEKRAVAPRLVAERMRPGLASCAETLHLLSELPFGKLDAMTERDAIDLARGAVSCIFQYLVCSLPGKMLSGRELPPTFELLERLLAALTSLLEADPDYSLNATLAKLRASGHVNPIFEDTLKANAENWYCRGFVYELCVSCYAGELQAVKKSLLNGDATYKQEGARIKDEFYAGDLASWRPDCASARQRLSATMRELSDVAAVCHLQLLSRIL